MITEKVTNFLFNNVEFSDKVTYHYSRKVNKTNAFGHNVQYCEENGEQFDKAKCIWCGS